MAGETGFAPSLRVQRIRCNRTNAVHDDYGTIEKDAEKLISFFTLNPFLKAALLWYVCGRFKDINRDTTSHNIHGNKWLVCPPS